jgi:rhomboid family protein
MMGPDRMYGMTPWVRRLLVANLLVFLLQNTLFLDLAGRLGFAPLSAFARPWTFLTYLFVHAGILHLAFNMLALFVFGPPVEERMGGRTFLAYYLVCGFGGAALSFLLMLVVPVTLVVGASGAILGVALAFAWYWPDQPIFIFPIPEPIPAKWLVVFAVAIDLALALIGANDGIAHLAHLGGIASGFVWLRAGDWRLGRAERRLRQAAVEPGVLVHPAARAARGSDPPPPSKPRSPKGDRTQAEVDRVLDKISARGMGSLTPAERKFLAEMSRKMRDRH